MISGCASTEDLNIKVSIIEEDLTISENDEVKEPENINIEESVENEIEDHENKYIEEYHEELKEPENTEVEEFQEITESNFKLQPPAFPEDLE